MNYFFRKLSQLYDGQHAHIFVISFLVYACINMFENFIHYNIGRNRDTGFGIEFSTPSPLDWTKIILVMLFFALLQGFLTIIFDTYWK